MSKPYVYLDRYDGEKPGPYGSRGRSLPHIQRNVPTSIGSHVRAAFHGIGDGKRSLEVWVAPNGHWSVETGPGPVSTGTRTTIVRGRLPIDGEPETVSVGGLPYAVYLVKSDALLARFADRTTADEFAASFARSDASNTCRVEGPER